MIQQLSIFSISQTVINIEYDIGNNTQLVILPYGRGQIWSLVHGSALLEYLTIVYWRETYRFCKGEIGTNPDPGNGYQLSRCISLPCGEYILRLPFGQPWNFFCLVDSTTSFNLKGKGTILGGIFSISPGIMKNQQKYEIYWNEWEKGEGREEEFYHLASSPPLPLSPCSHMSAGDNL